MNTAQHERVNTHDLAVRLAPHLTAAPGLRWRAKGTPGDDCGVRLILEGGPHDGATLWISRDHRNRVEIAGCFPMMDCGRMYSAPREDYARISFDATRDPRVLAREIERRCLTVYLPAYGRALAYIAADKQRRAAVQQAAARLASVARTEPRKQGSDGTVELYPDTVGCYRIRVDARTEGDPTVSMQLEELTTEQAFAVLELLKRGAS